MAVLTEIPRNICRLHSGREYIRLRTFNRHQVKGCCYPAPRFYMVPIDHAEEVGQAIIAALKGKPFGQQPEWWADFEKQYKALPRRQIDGTSPDCSTPPVGRPID